MGKWLPETCWVDSKINKIVIVASSWSFMLFTYIDDARSNTNQRFVTYLSCNEVQLVMSSQSCQTVRSSICISQRKEKRNPCNLQLEPACTIQYHRLIQASGFTAAVSAAGNKSRIFLCACFYWSSRLHHIFSNSFCLFRKLNKYHS
jgi:hypothetical protein